MVRIAFPFFDQNFVILRMDLVCTGIHKKEERQVWAWIYELGGHVKMTKPVTCFFKLHECSVLRSASARRLGGDGIESRPAKLRTLKVVSSAATLIVRLG